MSRLNASFLPFIILSFTFQLSASEDDKHEAMQTLNGQTIIFLEEEVQEASGIKTIKLQKVEFQPEFISYGKAINISPLLQIQNQYFSASTKQVGAKARFNQSAKDIIRLRDLHQSEAISTRKLQSQQSKWQSNKAIYNEMNHLNKLIIIKSNLKWGEKLTQWATGKHSPQFDSLIRGESTLLQIILPLGHSIPTQTKTIYISPLGDRDKAFKASYISQLPQVDSVSQGFQYIFITNSNKIKPGMNFSAWSPLNNKSQQGILIPKNSLGWHLGQAFVFIKISDEQFIHRTISNPLNVANGYFITEDIEDNEELVVTGSQMLLSHEFRSQIPDEDDD